ncbi:MAG: hypothetical protein AB7F35_02985 [Acetobacteraceae bacterium]
MLFGLGSNRSAREVNAGVVVGLVAEARIARRLGCEVAVGGGTPAGAEKAAEDLVSTGARGLVSFGLAGGLAPRLRPGDLVIPEAVLVGGRALSTEPDLRRHFGRVTVHRLLAASTAVASARDKRRLHEETGADAVDLESGAVALVAERHGLPFAVMRAVCDPAKRNLPPAALAALDSRGVIGLGRVLASLAGDPRQLLSMLGLALDAAVARRALLDRVTGVTGRFDSPDAEGGGGDLR